MMSSKTAEKSVH